MRTGYLVTPRDCTGYINVYRGLTFDKYSISVYCMLVEPKAAAPSAPSAKKAASNA